MSVVRFSGNPIITPKSIKPSESSLKVRGVFNPGVARQGDEVILVVRVAEGGVNNDSKLSLPVFESMGKHAKIGKVTLDRNDPEIIYRDSRGISYKGREYLSTLSHLRLARSSDRGKSFDISDRPLFGPEDNLESYGMEDARVVRFEDEYLINYTAVSPDGYLTRIRKTKNFENFSSPITAFCPLNKDVALFDRLVGGKYACLHRPHNQGFGKPSIWYAESPDLEHWGNHKPVLRPGTSNFNSEKIGAGGPPIWTDEGWLLLYHAKGRTGEYSLCSALLDIEKPWLVIGSGSTPFMKPEEHYEKYGFLNNVVFSNGHYVEDGRIILFYGAADEFVCRAEIELEILMDLALNRAV